MGVDNQVSSLVPQDDFYKRLLSVDGLPERLEVLGEKIQSMNAIDGYLFSFVDEAGNYLNNECLLLPAELKPVEETYRRLRWPLEDNDESARCLNEGKIYRVDAANIGQWHRNTQVRFDRWKMVSMVLIPIWLHTKPIGTLLIFSQCERIAEDTIAAIVALLTETAEAIEGARRNSLLVQGKGDYLRSTTEREQLVDFFSEANSVTELDEINKRLIDRFLTYFEFDFVILFLVEDNQVVARAARSLNNETQNKLDSISERLTNDSFLLDADAGAVPSAILRKCSYHFTDVQKVLPLPMSRGDRNFMNLVGSTGLNIKTLIHAPIIYGQKALGTMSCYSTSKILDIENGQVRMIELLARFFGAAMENAKEVKRLKDDRNRLVAEATAALEYERQTIARNLHDAMGASLTQLTWVFDGLKKESKELDLESVSGKKIIDVCDIGKKVVLAAHATISRAVTELHPEEVNIVGLRGAIEYLIDTWRNTASGVIFNCDICRELDQVDTRKAGILFRLVQEALTNAMRHTLPDSVDIYFHYVNKLLGLTVVSHGEILKNEENENRSPKMLMERTTLLGGDMKFEYNVGEKTSKVVITIPL
jgi:signal transduction histidine kinase